MGRRQINAHRTHQSLVEKFEREHTDTGPDIEQPAVNLTGRREAGQKQTRRRSRAFGPVVREILRRSFLAELPFRRTADVSA